MCKLYFNIFQKQKITPSNISNSKNEEEEFIILEFFIILQTSNLEIIGWVCTYYGYQQKKLGYIFENEHLKRFKYFSQSLHL